MAVLVLRDYRETDLPTVWRLHNEGLRQTGSHGGNGPWDDDLSTIPATYLDDHGAFVIAELDGKLVGMGALRRVSVSSAEIKRMRVDAAAQRQGIGHAILVNLEARAVRLGYRELRLDTTSMQHAAQRLYQRCGFEEIRRVEGPNSLRHMQIIYMRKTIAAEGR